MNIGQNQPEDTSLNDDAESWTAGDEVSRSAARYIGTLLKERYLIERRIGRGGVGVVYLARDQQLMSKPVVVKVMLEELGGTTLQEWFRRKFRQEIEALSRIDHPGVVGVLDAGEMPDGRPWLVTQFIEGGSLRALMQSGPLSLERVADFMRQIGHALSAAHDKGVFHRDIKPENIMIQRLSEGEELVKLIDFGIATVKDSQLAASREVTRAAGTLPYMAPEQLRGRPVAASDIYALGVVAYEMLTGQPPFDADSPVHLAELQRAGVEIRPSALRPDLPAEAEAIILKAMAWAPEERFERARTFGDELARALTARGTARRAGYRQAETEPVAMAATAEAGQKSESFSAALPAVEIAHVLYVRIVRYSALPLDQQTRALQQLQNIVLHSPEFRQAQSQNQLISLPASDGLALVFFRSAVAPVKCALELANAAGPQLNLKMGIHSGPVSRIADINAHRLVTGGGVAVAQQVAELGDEGHILISGAVADVLRQLSGWADKLHELGEAVLSPGLKVHLYNLCDGPLGNPNRPAVTGLTSPVTTHPVEPVVSRLAGLKWYPAAALALVVLLVGLALAPKVMSLFPTAVTPPPTPVQPPSRTLTYWVLVEKYRGKKLSEPLRFPQEVLLGEKDQVRLGVSSPQSGYLYVIGEGPEKDEGLPRYNLLFPHPQSNRGEAQLAAGQQQLIPETTVLELDSRTGTETIWLIWSAQALPLMESARDVLDPVNRVQIRGKATIRAIESLLRTAASPARRIDEEKKQTTVSAAGDLVIQRVLFAHG
ncbi:MAG TPA: protein kinase [Blastocatellia bacterium]|nr:protein kinase [Blastocatellia bacterium]